MYERFYSLRERPFSLSPDPDYLYPSRVHKEALGYLRYGIETHAGFVVITGEIGSGKTTLLQTVLRGLDRQTSVSRLVNTMLDPRELIEAVMLDFGLEPESGRSKPMLLRDLARFLVDQRRMGRLALLVIDEAQNLSLPALEEVRMLSNLETEKSKLIQIALIGQPNLRDLLGRPELEQLRQRVTVSYHLTALDASETSAYINHRLKKAALGAPLQFARPVTDLIHRHSEGLPRKINVIADAVLLFGYGEDQRTIDVDLTRQVLEELESTGVIAAPAGEPPIERAPATAPVAAATPAPAAAVPFTQPAAPIASHASPALSKGEAPILVSDGVQLAEREARLNERERQLAEQQRVLQESYALLRAPKETVAWPAASEPRTPTHWMEPATARARPPVTTKRASDIESSGTEKWWGRVRRSLFGTPKPVFED